MSDAASARVTHSKFKDGAARWRELDHDVLELMEACRKLSLSTAVELLGLVLAEVRDQAKESGHPLG